MTRIIYKLLLFVKKKYTKKETFCCIQNVTADEITVRVEMQKNYQKFRNRGVGDGGITDKKGFVSIYIYVYIRPS